MDRWIDRQIYLFSSDIFYSDWQIDQDYCVENRRDSAHTQRKKVINRHSERQSAQLPGLQCRMECRMRRGWISQDRTKRFCFHLGIRIVEPHSCLFLLYGYIRLSMEEKSNIDGNGSGGGGGGGGYIDSIKIDYQTFTFTNID